MTFGLVLTSCKTDFLCVLALVSVFSRLLQGEFPLYCDPVSQKIVLKIKIMQCHALSTQGKAEVQPTLQVYFWGRQNLLVYVHIAMAAIFVSMTYIQSERFGRKEKATFHAPTPQWFRINMAVRQAETFAPPQKMSAMQASKLQTKLFHLRTCLVTADTQMKVQRNLLKG